MEVLWILFQIICYWLYQIQFSNVKYQVFLIQLIFKEHSIKYLLFLIQEVEHLIYKEVYQLQVLTIFMKNVTLVLREQSSQLLILEVWLKLVLIIIKMLLLKEELFMLKIHKWRWLMQNLSKTMVTMVLSFIFKIKFL